MIYVLVTCVCLSLITGLLGFHDVLHMGLAIVRALFGLFIAGWIATALVMVVSALSARRRRSHQAG